MIITLRVSTEEKKEIKKYALEYQRGNMTALLMWCFRHCVRTLWAKT